MCPVGPPMSYTSPKPKVRCGVDRPARTLQQRRSTPPSPSTPVDRSGSSGTVSTSSMSDHGGTLYRDHVRAASLQQLCHENAQGLEEDGALLYAQFLQPPSSVKAKPAAVLTAECTICCDGQAKLCVKGCGHRMCVQCAMHLADPRALGPPRCPFCRNVLTAFEAVGAPHAA